MIQLVLTYLFIYLRARIKAYELQGSFPDARLESSHRGRIERDRQALDEHSVMRSSQFTPRRPFMLFPFVLGGKGQNIFPGPVH